MKKVTHIAFILLSFLTLTACNSANTSLHASLGNPNASVLIEEFSDFECPACSMIGAQLEELISNNPDLARLEFHHFPLSYHKNAFRAAEATECALDQGKFWEFAELNFGNRKNLTDDNLKSFAKQLGLDQAVFDECFDSNKKRAKIKSDISNAIKRGLSYTPSIYVNGQLIQWGGVEEFEAYLRSITQ